MKELLEIRINYDYAHFLFKLNEGKNLGTSVRLVELSIDDPRFNQIPIIAQEVKRKYNRGFYFGWDIKRYYNKKELDNTNLFQLIIKTIFEPTGEECGTIYDERLACEICGANRIQVGQLKLKKAKIPKKDISITIGGEIIVSKKFLDLANKNNIKGLKILKTNLDGYYQLSSFNQLFLSEKTKAGIDPWDFSEYSEGRNFTISDNYNIHLEKEIYKCPNGHTIGLNLLSEAYVLNSPLINESDFFESKQKIGVKRGLLRPESIYFCSQAFRKMVIEEKLTGFGFEVANIV